MSIRLTEKSWLEAEEFIKDYNIVIMAVGSACKEHGPHLPLGNDFVLAERLIDLVAPRVKSLILPTLNYGYYPAFTEYPISINISYNTFRDMIVDIANSLAGFGIKKFYILNTGVSTTPPIKDAVKIVKDKIEVGYLDLIAFDKTLPEGLEEQEGGTHADELETSMMMFLAPEIVKIQKAVKEFDPRPNRRGLTRDPEGSGNYSASGVYGNPTLATTDKGEIIVNKLVDHIVGQIKMM